MIKAFNVTCKVNPWILIAIFLLVILWRYAAVLETRNRNAVGAAGEAPTHHQANASPENQ